MTKAAQTLVRLVLSGEKHRLDKEILSKYEWLDEDYFLDERTRVRLHEKEGYVDTEGNEMGSQAILRELLSNPMYNDTDK